MAELHSELVEWQKQLGEMSVAKKRLHSKMMSTASLARVRPPKGDRLAPEWIDDLRHRVLKIRPSPDVGGDQSRQKCGGDDGEEDRLDREIAQQLATLEKNRQQLQAVQKSVCHSLDETNALQAKSVDVGGRQSSGRQVVETHQAGWQLLDAEANELDVQLKAEQAEFKAKMAAAQQQVTTGSLETGQLRATRQQIEAESRQLNEFIAKNAGDPTLTVQERLSEVFDELNDVYNSFINARDQMQERVADADQLEFHCAQVENEEKRVEELQHLAMLTNEQHAQSRCCHLRRKREDLEALKEQLTTTHKHLSTSQSKQTRQREQLKQERLTRHEAIHELSLRITNHQTQEAAVEQKQDERLVQLEQRLAKDQAAKERLSNLLTAMRPQISHLEGENLKASEKVSQMNSAMATVRRGKIDLEEMQKSQTARMHKAARESDVRVTFLGQRLQRRSDWLDHLAKTKVDHEEENKAAVKKLQSHNVAKQRLWQRRLELEQQLASVNSRIQHAKKDIKEEGQRRMRQAALAMAEHRRRVVQQTQFH